MAEDSPTPKFTRTTVKVPSATNGWSLDVWQYEPQSPERKPPIIVMGHGFAANKLMMLAEYAEIFANMGYAVLVFDYRRWGASDGTPRNVLIVAEQHEDYRTVINYARTQQNFDAGRVVLWGSSFSGGHIITLASEPKLNIFAAIAQCPYAGVSSDPKIGFSLAKVAALAFTDAVRLKLGMSPIYIPVAGGVGTVAALQADDAVKGVEAITKNSGEAATEVNASCLLQVPPYNPAAKAANITAPLFMISCVKDSLCLPEGPRKVAAKAKKAELIELDIGHFDIYPGRPGWEQTIKAETDFLKKHVPITSGSLSAGN